jgi:isopropylmalate/homocitrate/citramalate synthase
MTRPQLDGLLFSWNQVEQLKAVKIEDDMRDALQCVAARQPTVHERVELALLSADVGVHATFLGFPASGPEERKSCREILAAIDNEPIMITPILMARAEPKDLRPIIELQQEIGTRLVADIYIATSDLRAAVEGWSAADTIVRLRAAAQLAQREGLTFRIAFEDSTRTRPERLRMAITLAAELGTDSIVLNDTVGAARPDGARRHVGFALEVLKKLGHGMIGVAWHGHDDQGLALANALAAAAGGADLISGTFLGIGERAGNIPLEQLLVALTSDGHLGFHLDRLPAMCAAVSAHLGIPIGASAPAVGRDVFASATGTHVAAILKARTMGRDIEDAVYSGISAHALGREHTVRVGPHSGGAAAEAALNSAGMNVDERRTTALLSHCRRTGTCLHGDEEVRRVACIGEAGLPVTVETYADMSRCLNDATGSEVGFIEELATHTYVLPPQSVTAEQTHAAIRSFQLILAERWLAGEWPMSLRAPVWPSVVSVDALSGIEVERLVPVFVRTDESLDGEIYELQCPGGWWGIAQALDETLRPGRTPTLAENVADELLALMAEEVRVLHLFDTAGLPHDSIFFAKRVRATGAPIRYRGIDPGVFPADCNFVRAHSYAGVVSEDLFRCRLADLRDGTLRFDHPPLPIFDQKLPLALPFDPSTAHWFADEHRALFPYTAVVREGAVLLDSGEEVHLRDLVRRGPEQRSYYLKYAGTDATRNYGARAVYRLSDAPENVLRSLPGLVSGDIGEPWILQADRRTVVAVERIKRNGAVETQPMTARLSKFHGPARTLGALFLAESSPTVKGGTSTVLGPVALREKESAQ